MDAVPEAVSELRDRVFRQFREALRSFRAREGVTTEWLGVLRLANDSPTKDALQAWACQFYLVLNDVIPEWVLDHVEATFFAWENWERRHGRELDEVWWPPYSYWSDRTFNVVLEPALRERRWDISSKVYRFLLDYQPSGRPETYRIVTAHLVRTLHHDLKNYWAAVEAAAAAYGLPRSPILHSSDHLRWAALFQCGRLSPNRIASREISVGADAVRLGCLQVLSRIGLTPRRGRPGRPRSFDARI